MYRDHPKLFVFLCVVIAFNTLRYGMYLWQGDGSVYNWIMLAVNMAAIGFAFSSWKGRSEKESSV